MTTLTGYVMTLANSIIGVSLLAMPFCFKQCGVLLAVVLLFGSNIVTRLACHFLVKSAVMCRRTSFELVAFHTFGRPGKLLVELGVIGFLFGTCVAYFVVIGDLAPTIIAKLFHLDNNATLRALVLLISGLCVILPLSLLRNIESLAAISTGTMFFYALLTAKLLTEATPHLLSADWPSRVHFWRPEGILQCFPIFAMALSCQTQVFEILEVLPSASLERMNSVVRSAVGVCTGFYIAVGFLGYVSFAQRPLGGNLLLSLPPSAVSSDLCQLGFIGSIALSFPLVVLPCRASLHSLISQRVGVSSQEPAAVYIGDGRFKCLTAAIIGASLLAGLFVPNIEFVLGFVGSTIGVATCIIFPASVFINISNKDTSERLVAKIILVLGILVMILGTFVNIEAASRPPVLPLSPGPPPAALETKTRMPAAAAPPPLFETHGTDLRNPPAPQPLGAADASSKSEKHKARKDLPVAQDSNSNSVKVEKRYVELKQSPILDPSEKKPQMLEKNENSLPPADEKLNLKGTAPNITKSGLFPKEKALNESDTVKISDTIHVDAIAKEEKELKENNMEEQRKQSELLEKLKEHQEQQKKLLQEQQILLDEMKLRDKLKDHQEEQKKLLQEQQSILEDMKVREKSEDQDSVKQSQQGIRSNVKSKEENADSRGKMQDVIEDLKERKQRLDKTKGVLIAEEKKRVAERKESDRLSKLEEEAKKSRAINMSAEPSKLPPNESSAVKKEDPHPVPIAAEGVDGVQREKRSAEDICDKDEMRKAETNVESKDNHLDTPELASLVLQADHDKLLTPNH